MSEKANEDKVYLENILVDWFTQNKDKYDGLCRSDCKFGGCLIADLGCAEISFRCEAGHRVAVSSLFHNTGWEVKPGPRPEKGGEG